jgi:hypothetical protein
LRAPLILDLLHCCQIVYGPSGAGKTATILSYLRGRSGMYLSCEAAGAEGNFGSAALATLMNSLQKGKAADVLETAGERQLLLLICTYLLVYHHYKTSTTQAGGAEVDPAHWLLAQLFPIHFMGWDIFNSMYLAAAALDERWGCWFVLCVG